MHRYFICFRYDGTVYHGWQVQPNGHSVQAELQQAMSVILREPIVTVGAGRTDAGVHARKMFAHFDFQAEIDTKQFTYKLNRLLPRDISVLNVYPVGEDMHARVRICMPASVPNGAPTIIIYTCRRIHFCAIIRVSCLISLIFH